MPLALLILSLLQQLQWLLELHHLHQIRLLQRLQQVLVDCEQRLGGISLLHLGQILESLGLEVRPLNAPAKQLHRLQPPALVKLQDRFLLIEEAGPRGLVVADPSRGLVPLSTAELQKISPDGFQLT